MFISWLADYRINPSYIEYIETKEPEGTQPFINVWFASGPLTVCFDTLEKRNQAHEELLEKIT